MQVFLTENNHAPQFDELFPITSRDAFHESAILSAVASNWHSVLITDGAMAFHHSFVRQAIPATGIFDIEPFIGYSGPLVTTSDPRFVSNALDVYSKTCRELNIVAELVRFDPLLNNHTAFSDQDAIEIIPAKQVVIVHCSLDEDELLNQFSQPCRRDVRLGLRRRNFSRLAGDAGLRQFRSLYEASVRRLNSGRQWLFSDALYLSAANADVFAAYGVYDGDRLVSASLVLHHPTCSHYMLAASVEDYAPGASELLIYGIARESAKRGISRLMLGGGITSAREDGLLRFKRKFTKEPSVFYIGKIVHDGIRYANLCNEAVAADARLGSSSYFLKYRLQAKGQSGGQHT